MRILSALELKARQPRTDSNLVGLQKQKDADKASAAAGKKRQTAGELRMQKGAIGEL